MAHSKPGDHPVASDENRQQLRQWIDRWKAVGPMLDGDRWARLAAASEADLLRQAFDLLAFCVPGQAGDDGEGLVRQQGVLARMPAGGER